MKYMFNAIFNGNENYNIRMKHSDKQNMDCGCLNETVLAIANNLFLKCFNVHPLA